MSPLNVGRSAATLLALLMACALRGACGVEMKSISVGGVPKQVMLFAPSNGFGASSPGTVPLVLFLRSFTCNLPDAIVGLLPAARDQQELSNSDIGLARAAADATGAIFALVDAPRSVKICTVCAQSAAYALSGNASFATSGERGSILLGSAVLSLAAKAGADCPAWDSGSACCQTVSKPGGDVPVVLQVLAELKSKLPSVNASNVILAGVSAGGFMALRTACDAPAGTFAGVFSFAGSAGSPSDVQRCKPPKPLPVIVAHGVKDLRVAFGGSIPGPYPQFIGAEATLAKWASVDQCPGATSSRNVRVGGQPSSDLRVVSYSGCRVQPVEGWFTPWGVSLCAAARSGAGLTQPRRPTGHTPPLLSDDPGRFAATEVFVSAFQRLLGQCNSVSNNAP